MSVAVAQYAALSRRSLLTTVRQPRAIIPPILFPLMFMALSSAAFDRTTQLPGFPQSESFLQFLICATIVQGALFASIASGSDMAHDIEDGFFDRLVASPVSRTSILVGRVFGSFVFGFFQAWFYFAVGLLFGLTVEGGLIGMFGVSLVAAMFAAGVASIASAFAIRTGSSEAVLGAFPLLFSLMFISGNFFPRSLMEGWFKTAATINPLTHMVEGMRAQVITGLDLGEWMSAFVIAAGFFVVGITLATMALKRRLAVAA